MKRFIAIIAVVFGVTFMANADERPIEVQQLPKAAQVFITNNFAGVPVMYATVDRELLDTDYEVRLEDGTKISFNGSGAWSEISNKRTGIPAKVIPAKLVDYVSKHYKDVRFLSIDKDARDYEIKLSNGIELTFTLDGRLIGFDD
jgi:hypothetical protein